MQNATQPFHAIACRKRFSDSHGFPKLCDCQAGAPAKVRAPAKPFENHRAAIARRLAEPRENRLEDLGRPIQVTTVQQILATLGFGRIPIVRGAGFLGSTLPTHRHDQRPYGLNTYSGAVMFCPL